MRALLIVCLVSGCVRRYEPIQIERQTAAFLGPASGVYQVQEVNLAGVSAGVRILLIEINGVLTATLSQGSARDETRLAFSGELKRDELGIASADGTVEFMLRDSEGASHSLIFPATISIGANAARMAFEPPPELKEGSFGTCGDKCNFELAKLCDFDSTIAGVFLMNVEVESQTGECSDVPSFSSNGQWGLTLTTAFNEVAIMAISETNELEFGALLNLDRLSQTATFVAALPGGDVASGSSLNATIAVTEAGVMLTADFSRVTASGCTQHYLATGMRERGVEPGISCELPSSVSCPNDLSGCPEVGGAPATFELTTSDQVSDSNPRCRRQSCTARLQSPLCDDGISRRIAKEGCLGAEKGQSVQVTVEPTTKCVQLRCDSSSNCSGEQTLFSTPFGESCDRANDVTISRRGDLCQLASCTARTMGCPPLLNCGDFDAFYTTYFDEKGCPARRCGASFSQVTNMMLSDRYVIDGFDPPLGVRTTSAPRMPLTRIPGGNTDSWETCPRFPYNTANRPYCPRFENLQSDLNTAMPNTLVSEAAPYEPSFYRTPSGNVCLGLFDPQTSRLLPALDCPANQVAACPQPKGGSIFLQCLPPATSGVAIPIHVVNTSDRGVDLTVVGSNNRVNTTDISLAPSGDQGSVVDVEMPLRLQARGQAYSLTITQGMGSCSFDSTSGAQRNVSLTPPGPLPSVNITCD